ncbi:MAG: EAL domain-containing protein, partial [Fusobacteriaceae bacterium]|nr:EAL domain-containing protein [Fusobacteriaceae bacterium]
GFQVAIDDFGTGYSSLSYLSDLEVDFIKIDRKFVLDLNKEKGKKVLRDIINISHSIGCKVIIEGVENESQLQLVKIFGADFVQGFYFHKPNTYDNTMEYIRKQNYTF